MYENSSNEVSIKGIIVKILLIALVICVLIWIFPTKKDLNNNLSGISNNGTNINIDPLLDKIFYQNILILQNAGRAYYYASSPKNVGDITKITYQDLLNKNYLVTLKDKNGNACNTTNSYVQLTKTGTNKYEMKTYLQCGNEENYIITNLGCNELCPNACTNITAKPTNPSQGEPTGGDSNKKDDTYRYLYNCPGTTTGWSSWSSWSTKYVSANANREVEVEPDYTTKSVKVGTEAITTTTGYKTVETGKYKTTYTTQTYRNTLPSDSKNCDYGVQKYDGSGFYLLFTCTTEVKTPITEQVPITTTTYQDVYETRQMYTPLYRYRTRTTSNPYSVWESSETNATLLKKGCTVVKSELVTAK